MKSNTLTRIVAGIAIPVVMTVSGCMGSRSGTFTLAEWKYESKTAVLTPKDQIPTVSEKVYSEGQIHDKVVMPSAVVDRAMDYNKSTVDKAMDQGHETTNKVIENSPFYKSYKQSQESNN